MQQPFFESPDVVRFLTVRFCAALFVINVCGGLGVSIVQMFFKLAGLNTQLACSDSMLLRARRTMIGAVGAWGDAKELTDRRGQAVYNVPLGNCRAAASFTQLLARCAFARIA